MTYKSAILGCGPRAVFHIMAYEGLKEASLGAVCDKDRERLDACRKKFKIAGCYDNLEEMLDREKPDILHIVTPPAIREEPIDLAARFGVRGVIVEKPVALNPGQAEAIRNIVNRSGVKVAVNMQRRYFKSCRNLKKVLDERKIGDIRFVRCVTKGNILSMGPHMIDLLIFFLNDVGPSRVWAHAYGMNGYDYGHPAPANMLIRYAFPGQIVAYCEDAEDAMGTVGEKEFWQHLEFDFWGTKGRAWWMQNRDWGYQTEGMNSPYLEKTCWDEDDVPGQREFTRAMAHWLDDDKKVHLNCLDNAMKGFEAILGALQSSYDGRPVQLPAETDNDIIRKLEERIK